MESVFNLDYQTTVEGILFRLAKPEDFQQIEEFCWETYMPNEAVARSLQFDLVNRDPIVALKLQNVLRYGLSLLAIDPSKEAPNKIIGLLEKNGEEDKTGKELKQKIDELMATAQIEHRRNFMMKKLFKTPKQVLEANPGHEKMFLLAGLAVHKDYRGRGIAKELCKQSLEIARMIGCDCVYSPATHDATRKIFGDLGMQEIERLSRKEIERQLRERIFQTDDLQVVTSHFMSLK